jgi:hypothetical protein
MKGCSNLVDFGEACWYPRIGWHRRDRRSLGGRPRNSVLSSHDFSAFSATAWRASLTGLAGDVSYCPPAVLVIYKLKTACERPDGLRRSPSPWDGLELARQLEREGVVESIPPTTVCRILARYPLKPRRHYPWLSSHRARDTEFCARVADMVDLGTPPLHNDELVRRVDKTTSLQPRLCLHPLRPANAELRLRVEPEDRRAGAKALAHAIPATI